MGSSPPSKTEREYGRRLYVSDRTYQGQIRKPTDKEFDDLYKLPHSENKKPYMEDSYEEMEYFLSPPFGFSWDWPEFDAPFAAPGGPWLPPWLLIFTCQVGSGACFCEDQEKCFGLNCSHSIVGIEINEFLSSPGAGSKFQISESSGQMCITGTDDPGAVVYFDVTMVADPGDGSLVYGEHVGLSITSCDDDDCACGPDAPTDIAYDQGSSADTVNQTGSSSVAVTGGTAPYTWTISDTGLTMQNATTAGLTNTVNASGSACGCGTITITDACGYVATGYIRVVEDSSWSGYGDMEEIIFCASANWSASDTNIVCEDVCWRLDWSKRGGFIGGGSCPAGCLKADYYFEHSNGHCAFNCTYQAGARCLGRCAMNVANYRCT